MSFYSYEKDGRLRRVVRPAFWLVPIVFGGQAAFSTGVGQTRFALPTCSRRVP